MIELALGDIPSRLRCWVLGTLGIFFVHWLPPSWLLLVFCRATFRFGIRISAADACLAVGDCPEEASFDRGVPTVFTEEAGMFRVPSLGGIGGFEEEWRR